MNNKNGQSQGFTLLELLVVVAVIGVLLSVLTPALSKARDQSRRVVCASNLLQIYLANQGYASENAGFYVIAAKDMWGRNLHRWHGVRTSVNEPFDPLAGPLVSFLEDGRVKRCPGFSRKNYLMEAGQQNANFEAGCGGYGYNDEYVGGRSDLYGMMKGSKYSAKDCHIRHPASTVMFTDTAFRQRISDGTDAFIEYSFAHPPYWQWYVRMVSNLPPGFDGSGINGRPDPTIHFRHSGFTNVCWSDGHISKEGMDLTAPYVTHAVMTEAESAEMALGWFGPDNNNLFDID